MAAWLPRDLLKYRKHAIMHTSRIHMLYTRVCVCVRFYKYKYKYILYIIYIYCICVCICKGAIYIYVQIVDAKIDTCRSFMGVHRSVVRAAMYMHVPLLTNRSFI